MTIKAIGLILVFICIGWTLSAQIAPNVEDATKDKNLQETIIENGDTLVLATLDAVSISSPRTFSSPEEYEKYQRYKYYASKVYPYAADAIRIFRETEFVTRNMKKKQRKKHIKRLQKELKQEFKKPLKNLTKTQGKILMKMIEKELDTPMYFLIKDLRNGMTATYYSTLGKLYGYKMREGYIRGQDPILDAVLDDLDISYEVKTDLED